MERRQGSKSPWRNHRIRAAARTASLEGSSSAIRKIGKSDADISEARPRTSTGCRNHARAAPSRSSADPSARFWSGRPRDGWCRPRRPASRRRSCVIASEAIVDVALDESEIGASLMDGMRDLLGVGNGDVKIDAGMGRVKGLDRGAAASNSPPSGWRRSSTSRASARPDRSGPAPPPWRAPITARASTRKSRPVWVSAMPRPTRSNSLMP